MTNLPTVSAAPVTLVKQFRSLRSSLHLLAVYAVHGKELKTESMDFIRGYSLAHFTGSCENPLQIRELRDYVHDEHKVSSFRVNGTTFGFSLELTDGMLLSKEDIGAEEVRW